MPMRRLLHHELVIPILVATLLLVLNAIPWIYRLSLQAPGHIVILFHNNEGDYPTYVSAIQQGINGHLFTKNMYVTAIHNSSLYFIFYSTLGLLGRLFGLSNAHLVYHISRYILGIVWCAAIYMLIRRVLQTTLERTIAFVFCLVSAGFPRWVMVNGAPVVSTYMTWWTEFDPIRRVAFLPHYLMGHTLLALSLLFFINAQEQRRYLLLIPAMFFGWTAGLIHPPSLIILLLILPVYSLIVADLRKTPFFWLVYSAITITSLLLMNWQARQFPWSSSLFYERQSFAISIPEIFLAIGPVCLIALSGIIFRWRNRYVALCILWVLMSVGVIFALKIILTYAPDSLFRVFPISNIRFLQTALWLPISILAANAIGYIRAKWGNTVIVILLAGFAGITLFGYPMSLRTQITELSYFEPYHEPSVDWVAAIRSLDLLKESGPVLSLHWAGALIPTYSARTAYVGNDVITPDYNQKMGSAYRFYSGLPVCDAYKIITDEKVAAVFYGYDEEQRGDAIFNYPFLKERSKNGNTIIFAVIPWDNTGCITL